MGSPRVSNWSSFLVDRNSKMSIARQSREEAGPCPDKRIRDPIFLILEVKETFLTRKFLEGQKGGDVRLPIGLFTGIHLG